MRTRSNFERRIADAVANKGIDTYLPVFRDVSQWKDRKKVIERPLFGGYVFVRFADHPDARLTVLKTLGAIQILGHGTAIEPVADAEIEAIRQALAANARCFAHPFLREGTRVRVRHGVMRGVEGLLVRFKSEFRLVLSVELLCRAVAIEVDVRDVEPVGGRERQVA